MEPTGKAQAILKRLPAFYATEGEGALLYNLVEVFGQLLEQTETDLYRVMRSHFVDTADNKGSQGLGSDHPGDLDRLFSLYLEALELTAQATQVARHSDDTSKTSVDEIDPYRQRLKALIRVLRQGAATQQGIRDIVAANLGIFDDTPASMVAKEQIKIEEFLPQQYTQTFTVQPYTGLSSGFSSGPSTDNAPESSASQNEHFFTLNNPNVIPTRAGFQLTVIDRRPPAEPTEPTESTEIARLPLQPLINVQIVNADTQERFTFDGMLPINDVLRVSPDGILSRNGTTIPTKSLPPWLPQHTSRWYIRAQLGQLAGRLDQSLFDLAKFDKVSASPAFLTPEQAINYGIVVQAELIQQRPASFRVKVPWDIPGYTNKFGELGDHPRRQIPNIIEKVKAAGVVAVIAYEKRWTERHEHTARLGVVRSPFLEHHDIQESNFDIGSQLMPAADGDHHQLADQLHLSGVFDYTTFDSGNRFG